MNRAHNPHGSWGAEPSLLYTRARLSIRPCAALAPVLRQGAEGAPARCVAFGPQPGDFELEHGSGALEDEHVVRWVTWRRAGRAQAPRQAARGAWAPSSSAAVHDWRGVRLQGTWDEEEEEGGGAPLGSEDEL